uniref:Low-density lipoprotein receptor-related protein 2-like n=1 Tax=Saccoglossus kowalevskii TaxID=10224 RepID=A0ABM0MVU3_SACKO|nr:PREDICTED: low-density lipoprotein receptor-related protein 2-like [Saccoglossus kowalevskii]
MRLLSVCVLSTLLCKYRAVGEDSAAYNAVCAYFFPGEYTYQCADGTYCISEDMMCDDYEVCPDGSDEIGCGGDETDGETAVSGKDSIDSMTFLPCDSSTDVADEGNNDTGNEADSDGDVNGGNNDDTGDEDNTKTKAYNDTSGCGKQYLESPFVCVDRSWCIKEEQLCDGLVNCNDHSDEIECGYGETDSNNCTVPTHLGNDGPSDFEDQLLEAHNYFRCLHGVGALSWNTTLALKGQRVAQNNSESGKLEHTSLYDYGENLAVTRMEDMSYATGYGFVKLWYDEIKHYDYSKPGYALETGHFTQVVWADSKTLGCGAVDDGNRDWLACEYSPPGNYNNQFSSNVPQPL